MTAEIQEAHKSEIMLDDVRDKTTTIQNKDVLLDSDVSAWKNLKSKFSVSDWGRKNNPVGNFARLDKPKYYISILEITKEGKQEIVDFFDNHKIKHSLSHPTAFIEKRLYMLATILKGKKQKKQKFFSTL